MACYKRNCYNVIGRVGGKQQTAFDLNMKRKSNGRVVSYDVWQFNVSPQTTRRMNVAFLSHMDLNCNWIQ